MSLLLLPRPARHRRELAEFEPQLDLLPFGEVSLLFSFPFVSLLITLASTPVYAQIFGRTCSISVCMSMSMSMSTCYVVCMCGMVTYYFDRC
jgi:hypothetical protein